MSDFVNLALNACNGKLEKPKEELTQPNWIRYMMKMPLLKASATDHLKEDPTEIEADLYDALEDLEDNTSIIEEEDVPEDRTIIEDFIEKWLVINKDKKVMPTICKTLKNIGELQNYVTKDNDSFDQFKTLIVNYCLIKCNIKVLLAYKGNADSSWSNYFLKYISSIIKKEFVPLVRKPRLVNKSTFIFKVYPNQTITIFSKYADVSCIKDRLLELKLGNKVVANLTPEPGLIFKCEEKLFKSHENEVKEGTLELNLVIKNFKTGSNEMSFADELQNAQFLSSKLFKDCKQLFKVELSESVKIVESDCFSGCSRMKKLEVAYDNIIEGEPDYRFKINYRKPPIVIDLVDLNEREMASNDSFESYSNNDTIPINLTEEGADNDTLPDEVFDDGGKVWENGTEDKYDNQGVSVVDIDKAIERGSQTVGGLNDSNDIRWCLNLLPNKLHSDILYYTYFGLPIDKYLLDENGNVPIREIAKYLTGEYGDHNWSAEKYRATAELHNIYVSYTTLTEWKVSKNNKANDVKTFLLNDQRISKGDKVKWFIQLLSGLSYTQIAKKTEEKVKEENGKNKMKEIEKKEKKYAKIINQAKQRLVEQLITSEQYDLLVLNELKHLKDAYLKAYNITDDEAYLNSFCKTTEDILTMKDVENAGLQAKEEAEQAKKKRKTIYEDTVRRGIAQVFEVLYEYINK